MNDLYSQEILALLVLWRGAILWMARLECWWSISVFFALVLHTIPEMCGCFGILLCSMETILSPYKRKLLRFWTSDVCEAQHRDTIDDVECLASLFGFVSSVILVSRGRGYSPGMLVLDPCCWWEIYQFFFPILHIFYFLAQLHIRVPRPLKLRLILIIKL